MYNWMHPKTTKEVMYEIRELDVKAVSRSTAPEAEEGKDYPFGRFPRARMNCRSRKAR